MSIDRTDFLEQIDRDLSGIPEDEFGEGDREAQLLTALEKYNSDRPGRDVVDVSGDGGKYYEISALVFTKWVEGFSRIVRIEYPAPTIASDEAPRPLEDGDWVDDYRDTTKRYLYLPNHKPASTEKMRITYIFPHVFGVAAEGESLSVDVPSQDFRALCKLAAGLCCGVLAVKYGQSMDPTLGADVVNYAQKSDFYARRAKELIAFYEKHMGLEEGVVGASAVGQWSLPETYMFHDRRVG